MKGKIIYKMTASGEKAIYYLEGKEVTEAEFLEAFPDQEIVGSTAGLVRAWPLYSDAAGCHPKQVKEAMEFAAKMGVPTEYTPDKGQAVFTSKDHQKRFLKVHGMHNRDGSY